MNFLSNHWKLLSKLFITTLLLNLNSAAWAAPDKRCQSVMGLKSGAPLRSTSELATRFVKAHNDIRKIYNVPPLVWDQGIADYAQAWANTLKSKKCQLMHRPQPKYGENLAMNWTSVSVPKGQFDKPPEFGVQSWAKECTHYNPSSNTCAKGKVCGHFTQVVWRNSTKFGCGVVTCDGKENTYNKGRVELWVCNYDPPGNFIGKKPF